MKLRILFVLAFLALTPRFTIAAEPAAEPKLTVVDVSSHCDWCWGHTRLWHEDRYAEIIRQVLLLMRKHPHYVWLLENEKEQLAPFLEKAAREWPELIPEFWQRVREGRIEVIVGLSNPRLTEVYPETLVRNLVLGKEFFRRQAPDIRQKVYNAVDLMCGPSQMPQILAQAEYEYFMFSRPVGPQVVFWRKGLDGTRMLSAKCFYGYNMMGKYGQSVKGFLPVPVWREAIGGDDVLPDPKLPQLATTWSPNKKILGTPARYFEEVKKCGVPITELEGPLDSLECYVEAGLHGDRSLYMQNNQDEDLLLCLEKAQVMAWRPGAQAVPVEPLWHEVLSCTGHAIQWAWAPDYEERMAMAHHRRVKAQRALHETLLELNGRMRFRRELGSPLVVFNFHSWPITGPVQAAIEGSTEGLTLCDAVGKVLPVQLVSGTKSEKPQVAFLAENVPACGYKTFYVHRVAGSSPTRPEPAAGVGTVENDRYRVRMEADGRLEVFDKQRKCSLGAKEHGGLGEVVFYDTPQPRHWEMNGPLGHSQGWEAGKVELEVVQGPVVSVLRARGSFGPHKATRELRLWRGGRRLDYHVELDAAEGNGVFSIRFPLDMSGHVMAGIPFGVEPREQFDKEPFRGEYFVRGYPNGYYAMRWTDVSSSASGYTLVCPPGAYTGYAFDRARESLEFLLLRVRPLTPGEWGQMHPSIKGTGHHVFDCALAPHAGDWQEAASWRDAMESHVPLVAFSPDLGLRRTRLPSGPAAKPSKSPTDEASVVEVAPANVLLSSLRLVNSSNAGEQCVEMRLYETAGRAADTTIRLGFPVRSVQETNSLGRPTGELGKIDLEGNLIRLRIPPWKIATLRITPGKK